MRALRVGLASVLYKVSPITKALGRSQNSADTNKLQVSVALSQLNIVNFKTLR
jgi:hypothetical protein